MNQKSFGRRANTQPQPTPATSNSGFQRKTAIFEDTKIEALLPSSDIPESHSVDEELRAWKQTRKRVIPWRQLSFMASCCFGIASFVLPATLNENIQWLLYALMAMSLYGGFSRWWPKA